MDDVEAGRTVVRAGGGRDVCFAEYGRPDGRPVVWCHGAPGSRLEPLPFAEEAGQSGLRVVAIDRPGYGGSPPLPGRTIGAWVDDAMTVVRHLGLARFSTVGCSTGGAYALALAARKPDRVDAVVACCTLTDMRWGEGRATMTGNPGLGALIAAIWDAPDRESALSATERIFGEGGSNFAAMAAQGPPPPPADLAMMSDPGALAGFVRGMRESFTFGVEGFVDDRIADGAGWVSFDVSKVACPVVVLHGTADTVVPVAHARHTAGIVPGAELRLVDGLGHMSIATRVLSTLESIT